MGKKILQFLLNVFVLISIPVYIQLHVCLQELCELVRKDLIQNGQVKESLRFLDIGCGSGAISLYLLKQLPQVM